VDSVDQWRATYGHHASGGQTWTGRVHLDASVERVAAALLAVRPGRVGPDNAVLLHGPLWSRMQITGGPQCFIGHLGEASVLIEIDLRGYSFALQGRLGWRIVTRLEPEGAGTAVIREIEHLSAAKRLFVPLLQRSRFGLAGDARRLSKAAAGSVTA